MKWLDNLKEAVNINSYTANKKGVDAVGRLFRGWLEELGYECISFERELIGDHLLFKSARGGRRKILLLGISIPFSRPGPSKDFRKMKSGYTDPGSAI